MKVKKSTLVAILCALVWSFIIAAYALLEFATQGSLFKIPAKESLYVSCSSFDDKLCDAFVKTIEDYGISVKKELSDKVDLSVNITKSTDVTKNLVFLEVNLPDSSRVYFLGTKSGQNKITFPILNNNPLYLREYISQNAEHFLMRSRFDHGNRHQTSSDLF
jgi:hypothetical protein